MVGEGHVSRGLAMATPHPKGRALTYPKFLNLLTSAHMDGTQPPCFEWCSRFKPDEMKIFALRAARNSLRHKCCAVCSG